MPLSDSKFSMLVNFCVRPTDRPTDRSTDRRTNQPIEAPSGVKKLANNLKNIVKNVHEVVIRNPQGSHKHKIIGDNNDM